MTPAIVETDITNEDGTDTVIEEAVRYRPGKYSSWVVHHGHELGDELKRIGGGDRPVKPIFCPNCNLLFGAENGKALVLVDGRNKTTKTKIKCECGRKLHWNPRH